MQISDSSKFKGFSIERINQSCDYVQSSYIIVTTNSIETITFLKI